MTKEILKQEDGFRLRLAAKVVILVMLTSFLGCVAAIPLVYYEIEHKGFVVTAQVDVEANKVYQAAVKVIENPPEGVMPGFIRTEKIEKDDKKLSVTFNAIFKDETHPNKVLTHHNKFHVTAIGANRSQIVAVADTPGKKDADKTSALRIVKGTCNELGVQYTLVKGK